MNRRQKRKRPEYFSSFFLLPETSLAEALSLPNSISLQTVLLPSDVPAPTMKPQLWLQLPHAAPAFGLWQHKLSSSSPSPNGIRLPGDVNIWPVSVQYGFSAIICATSSWINCPLMKNLLCLVFSGWILTVFLTVT